MFSLLGQLLFPQFCIGCGTLGKYICAKCVRQIHPAKSIQAPSPFQAVVTLSHYDGVVKRAITLGKYGGYSKVFEALCRSLSWEAALTYAKSYAVIVSMPLHPRKFKERGFNQAEIIARHAQIRLGLPVDRNILYRTRYTKPQASLTALGRHENIKGCFSVSSHVQIPKTCLLVDDVWTTGATMTEAAKTLCAAGTSQIFGLTLAQK